MGKTEQGSYMPVSGATRLEEQESCFPPQARGGRCAGVCGPLWPAEGSRQSQRRPFLLQGSEWGSLASLVCPWDVEAGGRKSSLLPRGRGYHSTAPSRFP